MGDKTKVAAEECESLAQPRPEVTPYPARVQQLGDLSVHRALPVLGRRLVGPWCFLDRYGPLSFSSGRPMDVASHPHIGLQTVTWLLDGEVLHFDSLDNEHIARPGGVNVMTAGRGIVHAEHTPVANSGVLNGVQLWVALTAGERFREPSFAAIVEVPGVERPGGRIQVFAGSLDGARSSAPHFSELLGCEVQVHPGSTLAMELSPRFEHAVLLLQGDISLEGQTLAEHILYYLGRGRTTLELSSKSGSRLLLLGGPPFPEKILMWWNFIGRTPEEIKAARDQWETGTTLGAIKNYSGPRIPAPSLIRLARPEPLS